MCTQDHVVCARLRVEELIFADDILQQELLWQKLILLHGKPMSLGQLIFVDWGEGDFHVPETFQEHSGWSIRNINLEPGII